MRKILRLCPVYYPDTQFGGSVVADYELDKFLVKHGNRVRVVTTTNRFKIGVKRQVKHGVEIISFGSAFPCIYGLSIFAHLYVFYLTVICKWPNRIFIGGVWHTLILFPTLWAFLRKIPYIVTPHGMLFDNLIALKSRRLKTIVLKMALLRILRNAHKVYCTNQEEMRDVENKICQKSNVVALPLIMDLSAFLNVGALRANADLDRSTSFVISFIGRITAKKNVDKLINAVELLPSNLKSKCDLRIIGPDLEGLSSALGKKSSFDTTFVGPLFGDDLIRAYGETDLFVLASESENFAIGVVEAAASGAALLLSENVGVIEYLPDGSYLMCETNEESIALEIERILTAKINLAEMVASARTATLQFDSTSADYSLFQRKLLN